MSHLVDLAIWGMMFSIYLIVNTSFNRDLFGLGDGRFLFIYLFLSLTLLWLLFKKSCFYFLSPIEMMQLVV